MEAEVAVDGLCRSIGIPQEVAEALGNIGCAANFALLINGEEGYTAVKSECGDDPKGYKILKSELAAALLTRDKYFELGIPESIFNDTMGCFARFLGEHKASYGSYAFDRDWWVWRQLSLRLFRFGQLEYEYADEAREIHIHIPSGADICTQKAKESISLAKELTARFFPERTGYTYVTDSWLLSPELDRLLPERSRIRQFAALFEITSVDPDNSDFMQWVFGKKLPIKDLPEDTALRRSIKARLLEGGGGIGSAKGTLR